MAITIDGTAGTITGVAVGGLPDGIVDGDMLAANAVTTGKILNSTIATGDIASGVIPAGGKMLQLVSSLGNADTMTSSTSFVYSGHSVTITPSSTSSKIMVRLENGGPGIGTGGAWLLMTFYRDSTELSGVSVGFVANLDAAAYSYRAASMSYLDSPATTSAVTYKVYFRTNTSNATVYYSWSDRGKNHLTATEIAG